MVFWSRCFVSEVVIILAMNQGSQGREDEQHHRNLGKLDQGWKTQA